ncbi:MAG: 16S rRNA (adenine(1518)-N(6)/adenine(1519)-N(6))-dimethyltransferase RsmA [Ruminococcus sp.]|nr:16S rRNA (adenine(1518)-N(6)/adenine(1519)-N(6))-dimethyltransferase RsmA [Ruminococcus sp.]MCM1480273.1 16S rRNA (adenine(1518)-N(6)/adenine(1519)-N(6))-dimethyltransferase RsmA [Muribaculaceae bacterium]
MENLTNINVVRDILERHGFNFNKKLGQNFLVNPSVCPKIAELGNARPGWGILEIGTGIGVLTHELALRAEKVAAIEIDSRLMPILRETLAEHDNVKVINQDVMKADLAGIISENFQGLEVGVCANLPYYITSPVIMRLLESRLPINSITVMVQKEAGKRLCAEMGTRDAGAVTAAVRYYSEPRLLFNVSRGSFMPAPNVDSCVIRLDVKRETELRISDEKFFFKVVRGAFSQRRKNVCNSVSSALGVDKQTVIAAVKSAGISETARAEQLQLADFAAIADNLLKNN